ncbi:MAG: histidine phosphatase family protein [Clostridia bacterium]|nr:histidine phosphatase family protein [Clostridia bacterium]
MKTYKIYFIRHGLTEGNLKGQYIGQTDIPVIPEGLQMLEKMKEKYIYPDAELFYVSPMYRCRQTLDVLYPDSDPIIVPGLIEYNFGDFEGKTHNELKDNEDYIKWTQHNDIDATVPNGESSREFITRVGTTFNSIVQHMMTEGKTTAVVCAHGGVISTILATYGLPQRKLTDWECLNGKGYCAIINPSNWMRGGMFEVAGLGPFEKDEEIE